MSGNPECRGQRETTCVAAIAVCASIVSFLLYFRHGGILFYGDAVAHINIARRVFDSRTPGLLQLGTVWLPLPHLLTIPFLLSHWLWRTGVGGSIPSMTAYVLGAVGVFRLVRGTLGCSALNDRAGRVTSWFAAGIYGLNPNLLYLEATAMTESLYLALFIWAVVYFGEFVRAAKFAEPSAQARGALWKCASCLAAACLTRYDGWFLAAAIAGILVLMAVLTPGLASRGTVAKFVVLAAALPILWFAYNGIVYRNALEFANGPYSARAIERKTAVPGFPPHPGTNHPPMAALYFVKAGEFSVAEGGWQRAWILLALAASLSSLWKRRSWAMLLPLWAPIPFYMFSVAYGGVPIFTPAWWPYSLYNIRYGVQLLPALAVFVSLSGYMAASWSRNAWVKPAIVVLALGFVTTSYALVWKAGPGCYREAWVNSRTRLQLESRLAEKLRLLPANASLLMYLGEHVGALQDAGIPLRRTINEGNHRVWKQPADPEGLWERTLANPSQYADYVIAFDGDVVWQAVHDRGLPAMSSITVPGQRTATILRAR
jgi:hypothetical protein